MVGDLGGSGRREGGWGKRGASLGKMVVRVERKGGRRNRILGVGGVAGGFANGSSSGRGITGRSHLFDPFCDFAHAYPFDDRLFWATSTRINNGATVKELPKNAYMTVRSISWPPNVA